MIKIHQFFIIKWMKQNPCKQIKKEISHCSKLFSQKLVKTCQKKLRELRFCTNLYFVTICAKTSKNNNLISFMMPRTKPETRCGTGNLSSNARVCSQ